MKRISICFIFILILAMFQVVRNEAHAWDENDFMGLAFENTMRVTQVFSHHDQESLRVLFKSEPLNRGFSIKGGEFGFSKQYLSSLHIKAIEASVGQRVLDVGPGHGYFMAKLLAAGASHVTGVEVTESAYSEIRHTIGTYEAALALSFDKQYKAIHKSFLSYSPKKKNQTFNVITAFNVFHYFTPQEALVALKKIKNFLPDNGQFFFIANTPGWPGSFEAYSTKRTQNALYPGYITMIREDKQLYDVDNHGDPIRLKTKVSTTFIGSEVLKDDAGVAPGIFKVDPSKVRKGDWQIGQKTRTLIAPIKHSMFFWDKKTAETLFAKAGLKILEIYFEDEGAERKGSLSDEDLQSPHNIYIRAYRQEEAIDGTL
ncbi:MAG: class I SAM-dependent methyltransferase [Oligoflexales bacterium]|nr:class I SAM-dependent methyltransferase [Oligoflexales bacterium]